MKKLLNLSILVLTILFLFVGCREDGSSNGGGNVSGIASNSSDSSSSSDNSVAAAPEPATLLLVGSGLLGLAGLRAAVRKKYKK